MRIEIEPHDSFEAALDIGTHFILDVGAGPEISALREGIGSNSRKE